MARTSTSGGEQMLIKLVDQHLKTWRKDRIRYTEQPIKTVEPDMVFADEKVAVFYDGCYWHECPTHHPHSRKGGILAKDRRISAGLMQLGWWVVRMWEHEDINEAVTRVVKVVRDRRAEMVMERAAHIASHDPKAWCQDCRDWPHAPWPLGQYDVCMRCDEYASNHEPIA